MAYGDKTTVSIATGSRQALRQAPSIASVVTADDIAEMGDTDLDQVMETIPGVHVTRAPNFYLPLFDFRGTHSSANPQVLMMVDGVPMTELFQGSKGGTWGGLPLDDVSRIEIIRGPGSALYGADAFTGVINIVTKPAAEIGGTRVGVRGGSEGRWETWAQQGGTYDGVTVAAYFGIGGTNGSNQVLAKDAQTLNDSVFHTHASSAPGRINTGYKPLDASLDVSYRDWRFRFGEKQRRDVESGAGVASALDPVGKGYAERTNADISWSNDTLIDNFSFGLTGAFIRFVQETPSPLVLFPPGTRFPTGAFPNGVIGAPDYWENQYNISAFAAYTGLTDHSMRIGAGNDYGEIYKTTQLSNFVFARSGLPRPLGQLTDTSAPALNYLLPHNRTDTFVYFQDEWRILRDWTLTGGVRYDKYSDFGGTANPRLALVWDANYDLTAKLLFGQAFRAPSFGEEFSINNPVAKGNPTLRPEVNRTYEAAFTWQPLKSLQITPSAFEYVTRDIIRTVANPIAGTGSTYQNTGKQDGHGFEVEATWDPFENLRLSGNYSYQQSTDDAAHHDAGYDPHSHFFGRATWRFAEGWTAESQVDRVADRLRASGDKRAPIPDYTTVDATLRNTGALAGWDFAVSARNILNAKCLEPSLAPGLALPLDIPVNPRTYYVQLSHLF